MLQAFLAKFQPKDDVMRWMHPLRVRLGGRKKIRRQWLKECKHINVGCSVKMPVQYLRLQTETVIVLSATKSECASAQCQLKNTTLREIQLAHHMTIKC